MGLDYHKAANNGQSSTVSLDALRGQAMKRLTGVQQTLERKGLSASFIQAAKADPIGDMGFMSGLIVNMIFGGALMPVIGTVGLTDAFNGLSACVEGVSTVTDEKAHGYRARKLNDYPEGRRRCALEAAKTSKKFNLVSANQNNRFSYDVQADLACMFEILDMLDMLEKEGVSAIRLDEKEAVYNALKLTTKQMFKKKDIVRSFAAPLSKAV